jgi:hypothetical protein
MTRPLDVDRIRDADKHIDPMFLETPLLRRTVVGAELGCELLLKIKTPNPIRSFKGRADCSRQPNLPPARQWYVHRPAISARRWPMLPPGADMPAPYSLRRVRAR